MNIRLADYDIIFDPQLASLSAFIKERAYSGTVILADDQTAIHCLPLLKQLVPSLQEAPCITVPSGEANKNLNTCEDIWAEMLKFNIDRKAVVINLGGGVIGDMGGFAAACYKRGVDFIQIPTTILSQVDSSIGGKLGVDFKYGKNLIGVFKNPALVIISTLWLRTLSNRQQINGFAEIFKHALIADAEQWNFLSALDEIPSESLQQVLFESLMVKKKVVEEDPFEKGLRKILNFGHTIGHAVEAISLAKDAEPLLHGEAIAAGMIMEAYIGHLECGLSAAALDQITDVMLRFYGHYPLSGDLLAELPLYLAQDKKNAGSKVLAVTLSDIGVPVIDVEITPELLNKATAYYISLG